MSFSQEKVGVTDEGGEREAEREEKVKLDN